MTPQNALDVVIRPALSLLPSRMDTPEAHIMLLAIALQESRFQQRAQIGGPARGYWQFERGGGVVGVLRHQSSRPYIEHVCQALDYSPESVRCYVAIEHNDLLACVFARLLLWTLPQPLATNEADGWAQYIKAWRPGKPHPDTWPALYRQAQEAVA